MKNNLLKSVAAAATASALLFSTVTSFAATATTVTTYSGSTVSVSSTITGVAANTMVTYLASANSDGSVSKSGDILYIGQKTSDGSNAITFNYNLPSSVTATAGNVLAKVKYGASDETTAGLLNADASTEVKYGALAITKNNCTIKIGETVLTDNTTATVGNGGSVTVSFEADTGYAVKEVYLNGELNADAVPQGKIVVNYDEDGMELVVICGAVDKENSSPAVVPVMSISEKGTDQVGLICHKTGTAKSFGVYATLSNGAVFEMDDYKGYFPATVDEDGFYAVQIVNDRTGYSFPKGLSLKPAYETVNDGVYVYAGNNSWEKPAN